MQSKISDILKRSIETKQAIIGNPILLDTIAEITDLTSSCFNSGGKVFFCGNGGSAADAQHLAAEFSGRFYSDRDPLFSEALHVNTSYLTAVANDYGYEHLFERNVLALGQEGDVLICISTSGMSKNIELAAIAAKSIGVTTCGFLGKDGGLLKNFCDYLIQTYLILLLFYNI